MSEATNELLQLLKLDNGRGKEEDLLPKVEALLTRGADVNYKHRIGYTALEVAIHCNRPLLVIRFAKAGARLPPPTLTIWNRAKRALGWPFYGKQEGVIGLASLALVSAALGLMFVKLWPLAVSGLNLGAVFADSRARLGAKDLFLGSSPTTATGSSSPVLPLSSKHPYRGRLIVLEGIHGVGKSTLIKQLADYLEDKLQIKVVSTVWNQLHPRHKDRKAKNPRKLRSTDKPEPPLTPAQIQQEKIVGFGLQLINTIVPALEDGAIVLCDRYYWTSIARSAVAGQNPKLVEEAFSFAIEPDLVVQLDAPIEVSSARALERKQEKHQDQPGAEFKQWKAKFEKEQELSARLYQQFALAHRWRKVDATKSLEEVYNQTKTVIEKDIPLEQYRLSIPSSYRLISQFLLLAALATFAYTLIAVLSARGLRALKLN